MVHEALHTGILLIILDRLGIIGNGASETRGCGACESSVLASACTATAALIVLCCVWCVRVPTERWMEGLVDYLSISATMIRETAAPTMWENLQTHVSFNNRVTWGD